MRVLEKKLFPSWDHKARKWRTDKLGKQYLLRKHEQAIRNRLHFYSNLILCDMHK